MTDSFSIPVPCGILSMFNSEENTYQCGFGELLTAEISVPRTSMGIYNRLTAADVMSVILVYPSTFTDIFNLTCYLKQPKYKSFLQIFGQL